MEEAKEELARSRDLAPMGETLNRRMQDGKERQRTTGQRYEDVLGGECWEVMFGCQEVGVLEDRDNNDVVIVVELRTYDQPRLLGVDSKFEGRSETKSSKRNWGLGNDLGMDDERRGEMEGAVGRRFAWVFRET